jgi:hypothetical protein
LGVLNGIPAESTDTQNPDHPTRAERASIAKFFHATEGCPACCAFAASGHAVAPPSVAKNFRRPMCLAM